MLICPPCPSWNMWSKDVDSFKDEKEDTRCLGDNIDWLKPASRIVYLMLVRIFRHVLLDRILHCMNLTRGGPQKSGSFFHTWTGCLRLRASLLARDMKDNKNAISLKIVWVSQSQIAAHSERRTHRAYTTQRLVVYTYIMKGRFWCCCCCCCYYGGRRTVCIHSVSFPLMHLLAGWLLPIVYLSKSDAFYTLHERPKNLYCVICILNVSLCLNFIVIANFIVVIILLLLRLLLHSGSNNNKPTQTTPSER